MKTNEELVYQMKLDALRMKLAEGERDLLAGRYQELGQEDLSPFFQNLKHGSPAM